MQEKIMEKEDESSDEIKVGCNNAVSFEKSETPDSENNFENIGTMVEIQEKILEKEETSFDQNTIEDDKKVSLEEMNSSVTSKRTLGNSGALVSTEESVEKEGLSEGE